MHTHINAYTHTCIHTCIQLDNKLPIADRQNLAPVRANASPIGVNMQFQIANDINSLGGAYHAGPPPFNYHRMLYSGNRLQESAA